MGMKRASWRMWRLEMDSSLLILEAGTFGVRRLPVCFDAVTLRCISICIIKRARL